MKKDTRDTMKKTLPTVLAGIICIAIVIGIFSIPRKPQASANTDLSEFSTINNICELATLKSYYHNVVVYEKEPSGSDKFFNDILIWPFGGYVKTGYKHFWLEYSGIVETGIDASRVQIGYPDSNGVVSVYVPDAVILSVYADEDSFSDPLTEKGLFTKITGKDKTNAFALAQSAMREEAESDQNLLRRAKNSAKLLLERYIVNTGEGMGVKYTVRWLDHPL